MPADNKFDVRNIERNLKSKKLTKEELQEHLDNIEDYSDAYEECETNFTHLAMEESRKEEAVEEE